MSWRLLLSDYPYAVLNDELNVAVLAVLESGGYLTEDELAQNVKIDAPVLVKTLVALHADRLIEYSRQRVRVSERGKALLDRLTIHWDILDSLVANFDLQPQLKERLKSEIAQYRGHSFDQYLVSVAASRSWSALCRDSHIQSYLPRESESSGRLAIWMRDLAEWARSGERPLTVLLDTKSALKAASQTALHARLAVTWLEATDALDREVDPWSAVRALPDNSTGFFCLYEQTRAHLENTIFLDAWSAGGEWLRHLKSFKHIFDAVASAPAYASQHWTLLPVPFAAAGRPHDNAERALRRQLSELLLKLMTAHSFADLSRTTTLDSASLQVLLNQIKDRCEILLAEAKPQGGTDIDNEQR